MNAKYNFLDTVWHYTQDDDAKILPKDPRVLELLNCVCEIFIEFPNDQIEPPSSCVMALAANSGASFPGAVSASLNCITDQHLLLEKVADFIEDNFNNTYSKVIDENKIIPGFGHPSIKGEDKRVKFLLEEFDDLCGPRVNFCKYIEVRLPVKMNIGSAIAALLLDNDIKKEYVLFFPLVGRMFGWNKIYNSVKSNFPKVIPSHKLTGSYTSSENYVGPQYY